MANDLTKISGLWKKADRNGDVFFSGAVGGVSGEDTFTLTADHKILIFKNTYKEKENDPDYNLFMAPKKDKDARQEKQAQDNTVPSDIPF